jgi:hypothetical protein
MRIDLMLYSTIIQILSTEHFKKYIYTGQVLSIIVHYNIYIGVISILYDQIIQRRENVQLTNMMTYNIIRLISKINNNI